MSRILVTGGAGFIGRSLVRRLSGLGAYEEIIVYDNESTGNRSAVEGLDKVNFVYGDIRDGALLEACLKGVTSIVHLAAHTSVVGSVEDPQYNFDVNVVGTFQLLTAAKKMGIDNIILASSAGAVAGDAKAPIYENIAAVPMSLYGASKGTNEAYMSAFHYAYRMPVISLRFSNVYGPGSFHQSSVIAQFFKNILRGEPLTVYGDGLQQRDFLFIDDLTDGIIRTLNSSVVGIYQLGPGYPTSVLELIEAIQGVVGSEYSFDVIATHPRNGEVYQTWCDIGKARRELGFSPETTLQDGLAETWAWFVGEFKKGEQ